MLYLGLGNEFLIRLFFLYFHWDILTFWYLVFKILKSYLLFSLGSLKKKPGNSLVFDQRGGTPAPPPLTKVQRKSFRILVGGYPPPPVWYKTKLLPVFLIQAFQQWSNFSFAPIFSLLSVGANILHKEMECSKYFVIIKQLMSKTAKKIDF
jgi:hypothetical protein